MKIQGDTYEERCQHQLDEWVKGNPIHNKVDDECCPDFSCCVPKLLQPEEVRKAFKAAHESEDEDKKMGMLGGFLGGAISEADPNTEVYISAGEAHAKRDLN